MMTTAGLVLAGGQSRRMGCPKAMLPWHGGTLLDHATTRLLPFGPVIVSIAAGSTIASNCEVVVDTVADAGPLAGLLAGFERLQEFDAVAVLAVDLPGLSTQHYQSMLMKLTDDIDAVVAAGPHRPQPLAGWYRPGVLESIRLQLLSHHRSVMTWLQALRVAMFSDIDLQSLRNVNSPDDYDDALRGDALIAT
jgi:molybdenum cofactor guanylyltransferase